MFWPAATATMTAATILLAVMVARQMGPAPVTQVASVPGERVVVAVPQTAPHTDVHRDDASALASSRDAWPLDGRPTSGYLGVRYIALTQGVDALASDWRPAASGTGDDVSPRRPPTARELLQEMLPNHS